jgi:transposase InsO family protein
VHHSGAGSQYTAVHFGQTLFLDGLIPSIGTVGDALDNALAETTIGGPSGETVHGVLCHVGIGPTASRALPGSIIGADHANKNELLTKHAEAREGERDACHLRPALELNSRMDQSMCCGRTSRSCVGE